VHVLYLKTYFGTDVSVANSQLRRKQTHEQTRLAVIRPVSVSNSLSGGDRELDKVAAVGDPTHMAQIGRGHRVSTGEGQRGAGVQ